MTTERFVRVNSSDIDVDAALALLRSRPEPTEEQIEAWMAEDGDEWTAEDFAKADLVRPSPNPSEIRAVRERLGLTQIEFARRFGFMVDAVRRYEDGSACPTGAEAALLRVIAAEPEVVARILREPARSASR